MAALQTERAIQLPPEMMVALALNVSEAPHAIAARYGYDKAEYEELAARKDFREQLDKLRSSDAFERLMNMMGMAIAQDLFRDIFADPDFPRALKVQLMNDFFRYGKRDPKVNGAGAQASAPTFQINMVLPDGRSLQATVKQEPQPPVVDGEADEVQPSKAVEIAVPVAPQGSQAIQEEVEVKPAPEAPVEPAPLPVPDFNMANMSSLDDVLRSLDDA